MPITGDTFFGRFSELIGNLDRIQGAALALSSATLALIIGLRRAAPRVPGALLGVAAASAIVVVFSLKEHGIAVVGAIPRGLPVPTRWPSPVWSSIAEMPAVLCQRRPVP